MGNGDQIGVMLAAKDPDLLPSDLLLEQRRHFLPLQSVATALSPVRCEAVLMGDPIRVMMELGRKKPMAVAVAFDWPGWERSGTSEEDALRILDRYRLRYAMVAELAGIADEFSDIGDPVVVERIEGIGMTDFLRALDAGSRTRGGTDERRGVRTQDRPAPGLLELLR